MEYVLRPYQDEAVKTILKYVNSTSVKKPLVVAPTGAGKSLYIAATANAIKDPILVIQPNKELLEQNYNKYISYGNKASIYSASLKSKEIGHVTFATPMSLKGKAEYFKHVKLFILDECFTGETEILTDEGFKRFDCLSKKEKIAQWENNKITFVNPLRFIEKKWNGEIINFEISKNVIVPMTPNHEQIKIHKKTGKIVKEAIKDIKFNHIWGIPSAGLFDDSTEKLTDLERLYIITQADGSIHSSVKDSHTTILFSFKKERKIKRFLSILERSNTEFKEIKDSKNGRRRWSVKMPHNTTKILKNHFKYPMDCQKAKEIIEEMVHWDGSIVNDNLYYYSSKIKSNVDFYNEIAVISGNTCYTSIQKDSRKDSYSDIYKLFIQKNKFFRDSQNCKKTFSNYNGNVYCVEVPSNNIIVRHNGFTFISGNCHLQSNPSGVLGSFLKSFKNPKVVGLTASPVILTNSLMHGPKLDMVNRTRKSFWNQILYVTQIKEISEKFWCKIKYESNALNDSSLEWNSSKSEFTEASMTEFYKVNKIEDLILERVKTITKPTLIFCPNIGDATALHIKIPGSALVTSFTPIKEREELVKLFLQGKITFMINVIIFSVGFDYPGLSYVIDATPTASIVRWYQKYGRGVRLDPSNSEKVCTFVDYANGINRFGKLEDLEFVEDPVLGWGMFSKDKLLTGISISSIGSVRRKSQGEVLGSYVMTFGKYKNKKLSEIPEQYLRWMLKEFKWGAYNRELKNNIKKLLEW